MVEETSSLLELHGDAVANEGCQEADADTDEGCQEADEGCQEADADIHEGCQEADAEADDGDQEADAEADEELTCHICGGWHPECHECPNEAVIACEGYDVADTLYETECDFCGGGAQWRCGGFGHNEAYHRLVLDAPRGAVNQDAPDAALLFFCE